MVFSVVQVKNKIQVNQILRVASLQDFDQIIGKIGNNYQLDVGKFANGNQLQTLIKMYRERKCDPDKLPSIIGRAVYELSVLKVKPITSFDDLYQRIEQMGGVIGTQKHYTAPELKL